MKASNYWGNSKLQGVLRKRFLKFNTKDIKDNEGTTKKKILRLSF
jgi:hypothetical protein